MQLVEVTSIATLIIVGCYILFDVLCPGSIRAPKTIFRV